jgi:hypothetical protein
MDPKYGILQPWISAQLVMANNREMQAKDDYF